MPKITERWVLFQYIDGHFTPLSRRFKTKERTQKAGLKYSERERSLRGDR